MNGVNERDIMRQTGQKNREPVSASKKESPKSSRATRRPVSDFRRVCRLTANLSQEFLLDAAKRLDGVLSLAPATDEEVA
jgi:hypothetical protein